MLMIYFSQQPLETVMQLATTPGNLHQRPTMLSRCGDFPTRLF